MIPLSIFVDFEFSSRLKLVEPDISTHVCLTNANTDNVWFIPANTNTVNILVTQTKYQILIWLLTKYQLFTE